MARVGKPKYTGIICPQLLERYTYLAEPVTEEQMYELTWNDYEEMSSLLDGLRVGVMHGEYGVGKITRNWATKEGQWWVEFDLDTDSPSGDFMRRQVESGTLNALSLKHHHVDKQPYEVSLVFEPGRDGSTILLDAPKNTGEYKDAPRPTTTEFRAVGATRDAVIKAAKGAMQNVVFRDGPSEKSKQSDLHIVTAAGGSAGLAALERAEQLIAREQAQASEAAKQYDETRKALEIAKRRETQAQQHQKMDTDKAEAPQTSAQPQGFTPPPRIAAVGDQMRQQVDSQVNAAGRGGGSLEMEEEPTHALPTGQQMQKQIDRQTLQAPAHEVVAADQNAFAEFLAEKKKKAAASAPPAAAPKKRTGDPDVDAILDDPSISEDVKLRLISSMERKTKETQQLRSESEALAKKNEEANNKWRQTWADTTIAFQQMMLRKNDPEAFKKLQEDALSGRMDDQITSKHAQNEVAAMKRAMKMARSTQKVAKNMSAELEARAAALGRSLGADVTPGVAHSFSSAPPSRSLVAAGRGVTPFAVPNPAEDDEEEEDDEAMGLGIPKQFKKKDTANPVVAAGKGGVRPGTGFGHASGSQAAGNIFDPWNTRLEASYRRGAISEISARALLVPKELPSSHPVVISAAKGGLGANPKTSYVDQKGYDMSWAPGLKADYFHPDALKLVLGDGTDVPHEFELYPEDAPDGDGSDKGSAFPGQRSSRKRVKPSSVSFGA